MNKLKEWQRPCKSESLFTYKSYNHQANEMGFVYWIRVNGLWCHGKQCYSIPLWKQYEK